MSCAQALAAFHLPLFLRHTPDARSVKMSAWSRLVLENCDDDRPLVASLKPVQRVRGSGVNA